MKKVVFTALLVTLICLALISAFAVSFADVADTDYYAEAAGRMAERGILSGYGDGYYHGDEPITRAQVAALVCKMLGKTAEAEALAGKTVFLDVNEGAWYTGYINYAVANGIILGDGDGKFRPDDYVKYEEVVKVVVCVIGLDGDIKIDTEDWSKEYIETADKEGLLTDLIGKKGSPMLRSDIAVICDRAMTVLDKKVAAVTTTRKGVSGVAGGTATETTSPETTVPETTAEPPYRENQLPIIWF